LGQKLNEFFAQAEALAGIHGRVRLAQICRMTSTQAEQAPDTTENVRRVSDALTYLKQQVTAPGPVGPRSFEPRSTDTLRAVEAARAAEAARAIDGVGRTGEPSRATEPRPTIEARLDALRTSEARLRRYMQLAAELLGHRALFLGDAGKTITHVTETATHALKVERASVWFFDDARTLIRCADLYIRSQGKHSSGTELFARDYPPYFTALKTERTIAAHDAHTDPRTSVFSLSYLTPLGITSMLDVPIWAHGRMTGVICHEHTGPRRLWTDDDETFAFLLSNLIALAVEVSRPAA
jgi:hypothetical protein